MSAFDEFKEFTGGRKFGIKSYIDAIDIEEGIGIFQWRENSYDDWTDATDDEALTFLRLLANVLAEKGLVTTGSFMEADTETMEFTSREGIVFD